MVRQPPGDLVREDRVLDCALVMDRDAVGAAVATEAGRGAPGREKLRRYEDIVCFTFFYLPMVGGPPSMMGRFFFPHIKIRY